MGDVLTLKLGLGMDFEAPWPQPLLQAMHELGMGSGPPEPQVPPEPDEWMRRLGTLPLLHQPGERWLYNTGSDVLGVLVARASGQALERFLRERVFEPLGMVDTGFATSHVDRLGTCYAVDAETGGRVVYDPPDGQWTAPPAFAAMFLSGGRLPDGSRLLSRASVEAMTTDHVGGAGVSPDGSLGWGLGVGVQVRRVGPTRCVGTYGWDGGLGSSWANDPEQRLIGVVLSTDMFATAYPPPTVIRDFWTCVYAAIDD